MMRLEQPTALLAALPWLVLWWWFARRQTRALAWVEANVARRARRLVSVHSPRTLGLHLLALLAMGMLLVVAAAQPVLEGGGLVESAGVRLLVMVDASASMYATDVGHHSLPGDRQAPPATRLDVARELALSLVRSLPEGRFALASYSGAATVHLPLTGDRTLVESALRSLENHGHYQRTGSSLASCLDLVLHYRDERMPGLQAVLLGDGELPYQEDYDDALEALVRLDIPVHAVAIGSPSGQERRILDLADVVAKRKPPRVLRQYTTRRVDQHLQRISSLTGGRFEVASATTVERLAEAITDWQVPGVAAEEGVRDLSAPPLLLVLAGLLLDALVLGHRRRPDRLGFELARLGDPLPEGGRSRRAGSATAGLALLLLLSLPAGSCGGGGPRERAHRANESGIAMDVIGRHAAARPHYERSLGFGIEPQIPGYNLARSVTLAGDHAEAHDLYQAALELAPDLASAHYNDGVTLYRWGRAERDPRGCELGRARDLWRQARRRFLGAAALAEAASGLASDADANRRFVDRQLAELDRLIADPPDVCRQAQPDPPAAPPPPPAAPPPPPAAPPPPPGGPPPPPPGGSRGSPGEPPSAGGSPGTPGEPRPPGGSPGTSGDTGGSPGTSGESPSAGGSRGTSEGPPLSAEELARIRQELERIRQQAAQPGHYHRRTRAEQFPEEHWRNPDRVIWW